MKETTMIAYHGRQDLKDAVLAGIRQHQQADELVQGYGYGETNGHKFCAVGCTLESLRRAEGLASIRHYSHVLYERYLGVPEVLARLEDGLFESLAPELAKVWPERFAAAIRPGADLSMVVPKFLHWLLTRPDGGVAAGITRRPAIKPSIDAVAALYQRWIEGVKPSDTEWREARQNAAAAYAADAYAADAYAADADAADAYAAAAYAAAAADAAAADAAAADAARRKERASQADYLIALMEAA